MAAALPQVLQPGQVAEPGQAGQRGLFGGEAVQPVAEVFPPLGQHGVRRRVLLHEGQYSLTMLAASMGDVRQYTDAVFHDWIEDVAVMSVAARNHFPLSDMVEVANEVEVRLGG